MKLLLANQATAAKRRMEFFVVDATDGITAETGETGGQPQVSTDGGAWTNTGIGVLVSIGNGHYYAELTQTLVQTTGVTITARYKSAATAEAPGKWAFQVVAFNPDAILNLGLTYLDAAISGVGVGVGSGSELLTVTVVDDVAAPVVGATVYAHNVAGANVGSGNTNGSGVIILMPGTGVITLTARYAGYTFVTVSSTVSVGVNQTATVTGAVVAPPATPGADRCALYVDLETIAGVDAVGVIGTAVLVSLPQELGGKVVNDTKLSATSDANGRITWDLPRLAVVSVAVPRYVPPVMVTIPDAGSASLNSLMG